MSRELNKAFSVLRMSIDRRRSSKLKPVRIYQPTYQLNSRNKFNADKIVKLLKRIVDEEMEEVEYYSEKIIPDICLKLAETIRNAIKEENYDRYRIIVCVSISQRRNQGIHVFHSFLWDYERDSFATYNFENPHMFLNVVVYGIYFD